MPGTTPAASQLDWLISSTTTMVLFCSKAIRERLRSSTLGMGAPPSVFAQRQRCQTFAAVPIASRPVSEVSDLQTYFARLDPTTLQASHDQARSGPARSSSLSLKPVPALAALIFH